MTLEQVVTVRLHLQRETVQDMSHWVCGRLGVWACGREGARDPRTGSNRTPSPTERNNTRHESWVCGRAVGSHVQTSEHLTSKRTYYIFQL